MLLPTVSFTEKDALWTNMEGRVQMAKQATHPPLNAKEDWKVFRALSEKLGEALDFDSHEELRNHLSEVHKAYVSANFGRVVESVEPLEPAVAASKLKVNKAVFAKPVSAYYLNNALLRESATMHKCQAEVDVKNTIVRKAS